MSPREANLCSKRFPATPTRSLQDGDFRGINLTCENDVVAGPEEDNAVGHGRLNVHENENLEGMFAVKIINYARKTGIIAQWEAQCTWCLGSASAVSLTPVAHTAYT